MKKILTLVALSLATYLHAQTGSVEGLLTDKEFNNEPLAFANVIVKGTTRGTTSDFDGLYLLEGLEPGPVTLIFSFVGYTVQEKTVQITAGETVKLNVVMEASAASLDEVILTVNKNRETEEALLIEQRKAKIVIESIGAEQLTKTGVSDASAATTKIAGVSKSESSSEVYIRGLGDRYLMTTLNGLPIPSDDVSRKNINLNLFSTNIIQNVSVSKTFTASNFADQASGNVNIETKKYNTDEFKVSLNYGVNTSIYQEDFKVTANNKNQNLGFFDKNLQPSETINNGNWDTNKQQPVGNFGATLSGAKRFFITADNFLDLTASLSHSSKSLYKEGIFKEYQDNVYKREFTDMEDFSTTKSTTALLNLNFNPTNIGHEFSFSSLFVNRGLERLYEQGRSGTGRVLDQRDEVDDFGAFARDQNYSQTLMWVNQLHGKHTLFENNKLFWSAGLNNIDAQEPNRIRNEVNILTPSTDIDVLRDGRFQQRKSSQKIKDNEFNLSVYDETKIKLFSDEYDILKFGYDYREKKRDFNSKFFGLSTTLGQYITDDIDLLSEALNPETVTNGDFEINEQNANMYQGVLRVNGFYTDYSFNINKFSGNLGIRYEIDEINMDWDVNNFGIGGTNKKYNNFLPSLNFKYGINDNHSLRLASSLTNTLPEFKEISLFVYISPSGRGIIGNEDLEKSDNFNLDFKYEFFPTKDQLLSVSAFYKNIINPINQVVEKGSTGYITFANTGAEATILGLETEGKLKLFEKDNTLLRSNYNVSYMYTNQDLKEEFHYNGIKESKLQGAADLIGNVSLTMESGKKESPIISTLLVNYTSDKIAILGASNNANSAINGLFNNPIIENQILTLDFIFSKTFQDNLKLTFRAKNLIDPYIDRTQNLVTRFTGEQGKDVIVSRYKRGREFTLGLNFTF